MMPLISWNRILRTIIITKLFIIGCLICYNFHSAKQGIILILPPSPAEVAAQPSSSVSYQECLWRYNQLAEETRHTRRNKTFPCVDSFPKSYQARRGNYHVLYDYIKPSKRFLCDESITYTTNGDWTFLDNLTPTLERWKGPLSIALYAPGTDFDKSLKRIQYLRECSSSSLIKELVTFHLFYDLDHVPQMGIPSDPEQLPVNCSDLGLAVNTTAAASTNPPKTYRNQMDLLYPINVARNIAREMAVTHYVLPSDIELYPSPNLIPNFLKMIRLNKTPSLQRPSPKVFVLPVFELEDKVTSLPQDKDELLHLLRNRSAIPFHQRVCSYCHQIPNAQEWPKTKPVGEEITVFHVGKRHRPHQHWEPFYIGTKCDPMWDERLSWDGKKDKMVQGYQLCLLDYDFHVLDNAFLVHRPGIKGMGRRKPLTTNPPETTPIISKQKRAKLNAVTLQTHLISRTIVPELKRLYGDRPECTV